jgi:Transposase
VGASGLAPRKASIRAVSIDMSGEYQRAIRAAIAHAEICFDPFHVCRLASRATDQVRRDEYNAHERSHTATGRWVKGTRWSLLKAPERQTLGQLATLDEVQQANSRLYRAFLLREELRLLYHLANPALAPAHLDAWLAWASRSRLAPFVRLARTLRAHRHAILAAIRLGLANGRLEGLNSKIRLISHRSFGFHSAAALIALVYPCCAGVTIELPRRPSPPNPPERLILTLALLDLSVEAQRERRVGVADLRHDEARIAPGGERECDVGTAEGVRGHAVGQRVQTSLSRESAGFDLDPEREYVASVAALPALGLRQLCWPPRARDGLDVAASRATFGSSEPRRVAPAGWRHSQARNRAGDRQSIREGLMASDARERAARAADAATERIRDLNEQVLERIKSGGESALEAYERTLKTVADYQEAAGQRGAEWVTGLAKAQAQFTRELASASPAAARELSKRVDEVTDAAARQARRVPGEPQAEAALRGAAALEQDLPIANYDKLSVKEIDSRLRRLSELDRTTVEVYERKHKNRKTVLHRIESLRSTRD